jgi:hypothetical protein
VRPLHHKNAILDNTAPWEACHAPTAVLELTVTPVLLQKLLVTMGITLRRRRRHVLCARQGNSVLLKLPRKLAQTDSFHLGTQRLAQLVQQVGLSFLFTAKNFAKIHHKICQQ